MTAYVGADWSATKVVCATAVRDERPRRLRGCRPALDDVQDFVQRVRERHPDATEVHVLLEAGAPVWQRLFHHRTLQTDAQPDPLTRLAAAHERVSRELVRARQQLRDRLAEHMPLVNQALASLDTAWVRVFLRRVPTPWHAQDLDATAFREATPRCSGKHRDALWAALQATKAPWLDAAMARVEALCVQALVDRIELLQRELDTVDAELDALTADLDGRKLLETVAGIGLQQSTTLLQFAFRTTPGHRDEAATRLGAAPVFVGSGERPDGRPKGRARMRRAAHRRARRSTYLLGRLAQRHLPWAAAQYAYYKARGKTSATAYRCIARSLLRILTAMLDHDQPYDEDRYVQALEDRGVPWALAL